jgi:hypothetical protein
MKCGVVCLRFKVTNANLCIRNEKEEKNVDVKCKQFKAVLDSLKAIYPVGGGFIVVQTVLKGGKTLDIFKPLNCLKSLASRQKFNFQKKNFKLQIS